MKANELDLREEIFTHVDDATGQQVNYAVGPLYALCMQPDSPVEKVKIAVEAVHAQYCWERRGVEPERIQALMEHPDWLTKPILFVITPDGGNLLIDGTHRYVAFYALKAPEILAYLVPWELAKPYVVEDLPHDDHVMQHSHLVALRKLFGMAEES